MAARKKKTANQKGGRPPKVGQGLWEKNDVPDTGTIVCDSGTDPSIEAASNLDQEQREKLAKLLSKKMSLEDLADNLVELAQMRTDKTAAVGLRAIQEINAIIGIKDQKAQESASMFQLPDDTKVQIKVEKVVN